jgi:choline dehydrogenase
VYDYVIVGAGSAGCVLALRLTEDPATRVLLIEAGPPDDADEIHIPAALNLLLRTSYDWDYATVPQDRAAGRRIYWAQGRTLGGSSSVSAMIYTRGSRYDYDAWRDEYGCAGWGYTDLLPYFRRSEANSRGASAYHGADGPMRVEDARSTSPLSSAFVDAAKAAGFRATDDFNGPRQDGVGFYQVTRSKGRRWSAADGYLREAAQRPNLTVQVDALATRVFFQGDRAAGVRYLFRGAEEIARADREVILAAGVVNSPQLLMLSGIGPADHLREYGIEVVADSPGVGGNLSDHPMVTVMWHTPKARAAWEQLGLASLMRWKLLHNGPFATNVAEAGGFGRSMPSEPAPDIQLIALPGPYEDQGLADPAGRMLSLLIALVAPGSRGRITLRSPDPRHKPAIDPAYLSDASDLEPLVKGIRMAREIAACAPLARVCTGEHAPGTDVRSDDQFREFARRDLGTLHHPVGTCSMGGDSRLAASKITSVVDTELRVRGAEGLRVVDASVMPTAVRGNTGAAVIAIAERAADLIVGRAPLAPAEPMVPPTQPLQLPADRRSVPQHGMRS